MLIEIFGSGCPKCKELTSNVKKAVNNINIEIKIQKVTDVGKMGEYGVMITPALAIDGEVVSSGKILTVDEIKKFINEKMD